MNKFKSFSCWCCDLVFDDNKNETLPKLSDSSNGCHAPGPARGRGFYRKLGNEEKRRRQLWGTCDRVWGCWTWSTPA